MMTFRISIALILLATLTSGCYVRKSYSIDDYRMKSDLRITSVMKTSGEKISFSGDGGKYDPILDKVYGPVANDSEESVSAQEIRFINTERPNPMIPVFEYIAITVGVIIGSIFLYHAIFPTPTPGW